MNADEFLVKLKMIMPEDCKPQETVVFFDEIQKCPEIVTKIKFLVEEGSFKYVMSGSLLGVELKGIASVPVDEFIHQKLLSLFFIYLIVGGMPDAVKSYIATKDIREVDKVQRDIVALYKEDFSQYESEDKKLKLISIYDIIPAELSRCRYITWKLPLFLSKRARAAMCSDFSPMTPDCLPVYIRRKPNWN